MNIYAEGLGFDDLAVIEVTQSSQSKWGESTVQVVLNRAGLLLPRQAQALAAH